MAQGIYLDNATSTRPSVQAINKMLPFLMERWGSPTSPHQGGHQLFPAIKEAYREIYSLLGAKDEDQFVFTSSGAEAVNQVFLSTYFDITRSTGKNQILISAIDEAPALMSLGRLEQLGCVSKIAHVNSSGKITAQIVADSITPRTALVSLSWANGLTGVVNPIGEIATLCEERGIKLHLEASHVLGKLFYELDDVGAHFISFNGDNIHAPRGTGGLWIKSGTKCSPFILGGIEQAGHRAGSLNVPGLVALGQASKETLECRDLICTEVARLRDRLEKGILEKIPETKVFFKDQERIPNCTAIAFPGIANEALLYALSRKGVYASIGGGSFQQIGLILEASGIEKTVAHSAISFSLSRETTEDDIECTIEIIVDCVSRLRQVSQKLR